MLDKRIKYLRENMNLTQKELANKLGISSSTIGMYESGRRNPDTSMLNILSDFFNVSVDYLMGRTNIKNFTSDDELKKLIIQSNVDDNDLCRSLLSLKKKLNSNKKMFIAGNELPQAHKDMLLSVINVLLTQNQESK
ncbi:helix-turn-helix domain-containing protein [Clostridium paraputrificum]|uniref:helix-turn-helix domain-containing protein n=1 Tax=Clostridium paraputrificum TaxID=29363 RepID=UPI003D33CEB3